MRITGKSNWEVQSLTMKGQKSQITLCSDDRELKISYGYAKPIYDEPIMEIYLSTFYLTKNPDGWRITQTANSGTCVMKGDLK